MAQRQRSCHRPATYVPSNLNIRTAPLLLCLVVLLTLSAQCALADDELVWAELKHGGEVILLRHTRVDIQE